MDEFAGSNNKEYYNDVEEGNIYLDHILDLLAKKGITTFAYTSRKNQHGTGETKGGIEVKFDKKIKQYGSMFIETEAKGKDGQYRPSGIYGNQSWLYVQGDYECGYALSVKTLRVLHGKLRQDGTPYYARLETPIKTAKGFKFLIEDAKRYCEFELRNDQERKY
jgi:hypothetical protein